MYCSGYENGGYTTIYDCEVFGAGHVDGEGVCKYCYPPDVTQDGPLREIVRGKIVFICENCWHGVDFSELEVFQALFHEHDPTTCKHCRWHKQKTGNYPRQFLKGANKCEIPDG